MSTFESRRLEHIQRNQAIIRDLGLENAADTFLTPPPSAKRRKPNIAKLPGRDLPTRKSGRIAASNARPSYAEVDDKPSRTARRQKGARDSQPGDTRAAALDSAAPTKPLRSTAELKEQWSLWKPSAPAPQRDEEGTLSFSDRPTFTPNKTPEEMIREGCFGGSYFRPLYSKALGVTISEDWLEIPSSWVDGLNISEVLASEEYDPSINKYGVACGQSIEEWEAAGWINHEYDVRGWFQWYCRFYQGRRCDDDERQVSRWRRCVGDTGRWRRTLLKKYVALGIRTVADEGDDEQERDVSPVVHQTCHHWAYEVRQPALDRFWQDGR